MNTKIKNPEEFLVDDRFEISNVATVNGIFNGSESLHEGTVRAIGGPIYEVPGETDTMQRWIYVKPNQDRQAFECWLNGKYRHGLGIWTVDHPNC